MKILITGGAGFIASHIADAYISRGHEVVIVDNLSTGSLDNLNRKAEFYREDICSPNLEGIFRAEKPELVSHHAAQISVPLSVKDPVHDTEVNVKGMINLMQCCVKHKVSKVIFASSGGAVYGEAESFPASEQTALKPLSPYAVSKAAGENLLYYYSRQYGIDHTILRYANVYGPRQAALGEAGVVATFISSLLQNRQPNLHAFPDQPDGMTRDYIYVHDIVAANLLALELGSGEIFNIGTGKGITTGQLYREIARLLRSDIVPKPAPPRDGDLPLSLLDCAKAEAQLGFKPVFDLPSGLAETIKYFMENIQR